jgi:hypothetical protein
VCLYSLFHFIHISNPTSSLCFTILTIPKDLLVCIALSRYASLNIITVIVVVVVVVVVVVETSVIIVVLVEIVVNPPVVYSQSFYLHISPSIISFHDREPYNDIDSKNGIGDNLLTASQPLVCY